MEKGRDILSQFGSDTPHQQAERASSGGVMPGKTIPYSPPLGPTRIMATNGPGLHGSNAGNLNRPIGNDGGSAGGHGTNHGNKGSQGRH